MRARNGGVGHTVAEEGAGAVRIRPMPLLRGTGRRAFAIPLSTPPPWSHR